jgi:carboxyl-terminal processing protease
MPIVQIHAKYVKKGWGMVVGIISLVLMTTGCIVGAAVGSPLGKPVAVPTKVVRSPEDQFDKSVYSGSRTLAEVCHLVKTKYYRRDVDVDSAWKGAITALVSIDPHSTYIDSKPLKDLYEQTSGQFFGIGVVIAHKEPDQEFLAIVDTVGGGPAEKAGMKAGDKLIEVDGHAVKGLNTDEVTAKLKGARYSTVNVKVMREGNQDPLHFSIKRDEIKEQGALSYFFKDHGIYYVHLGTFASTDAKKLETFFSKAIKNKGKGIILDLRNNSGGLLNAAVDIAGLFLERNSLVVVTKDRDNKNIDEYRTTREPLNFGNIPVIVLVNNFSASAAEILAGALKVHSQEAAKKSGKRPTILLIGTKTFGKGSVQEVIPLHNDCAIKLTTALYFLPNNETIQGLGIEPDLAFERKFPPTSQMQWVNQVYGRESALRNSIKVKEEAKQKTTSKKDDKAWKEKRKEAIESDSQIRDAVTCLNILSSMPNAWHNRPEAINLLNKVLAVDTNMKSEEVI